MANKTGRKSLREELKIIERYAQLTPHYFRILLAQLESEDKDERQKAMQMVTPAMVKFIPQDIDVTSNDEHISGLTQEEKIRLLALLNESESS